MASSFAAEQSLYDVITAFGEYYAAFSLNIIAARPHIISHAWPPVGGSLPNEGLHY